MHSKMGMLTIPQYMIFKEETPDTQAVQRQREETINEFKEKKLLFTLN